MSTKLLKKQLAGLSSSKGPAAADAPLTSSGKGVSKPVRSEHSKRREKSLKAKELTKEEIRARNLRWHKETKKTQQATLELMNKVREMTVCRRCCFAVRPWPPECVAPPPPPPPLRCCTAHPPPARASLPDARRSLAGQPKPRVTSQTTISLTSEAACASMHAPAACSAGGAPAARRPLQPRAAAPWLNPHRMAAGAECCCSGACAAVSWPAQQRQQQPRQRTRRKPGAAGVCARAPAAAAAAGAPASSPHAGAPGPRVAGPPGARRARARAPAAAAGGAADQSGAGALAGLFMAYAAQMQQQMEAQAAAAALPGANVLASGVSFHPPGVEAPLLDGVSFDLRSNQLGLVIGRSGSGKTTLLQMLAGLTEQTAGDLYISRGPLAGAPPGALPPPTHIEERMQQVGGRARAQLLPEVLHCAPPCERGGCTRPSPPSPFPPSARTPQPHRP